MKTVQEKQRYTLEITNSNRLVLSEREEKSKPKVKQDSWFYLGFVGEIGYAIALPIAGGALIGGYIDRHFSIYPRATLLLLLVGAIISILGFIRTIQVLINKKN
jgi:predicted F0F1-ATPase subunit